MPRVLPVSEAAPVLRLSELAGALSHALSRLPALPAIARGIWSDKTARFRKSPPVRDVRYLLQGTQVS